jgi:hypothetical protein
MTDEGLGCFFLFVLALIALAVAATIVEVL